MSVFRLSDHPGFLRMGSSAPAETPEHLHLDWQHGLVLADEDGGQILTYHNPKATLVVYQDSQRRLRGGSFITSNHVWPVGFENSQMSPGWVRIHPLVPDETLRNLWPEEGSTHLISRPASYKQYDLNCNPPEPRGRPHLPTQTTFPFSIERDDLVFHPLRTFGDESGLHVTDYAVISPNGKPDPAVLFRRVREKEGPHLFWEILDGEKKHFIPGPDWAGAGPIRISWDEWKSFSHRLSSPSGRNYGLIATLLEKAKSQSNARELEKLARTAWRKLNNTVALKHMMGPAILRAVSAMGFLALGYEALSYLMKKNDQETSSFLPDISTQEVVTLGSQFLLDEITERFLGGILGGLITMGAPFITSHVLEEVVS